MAKDKSPKYVSLEPNAFLSDKDFQIMTAEERGVYCTIIFYLYCNNGKIENYEEDLKNLCNSKNDFCFKKILKKFQNRNGFLRHNRVNKELKRAKNVMNERVKAAKKRWQMQSKCNAIADAKAMLREGKVREGKVREGKVSNNTYKTSKVYLFSGHLAKWILKNNPSYRELQKDKIKATIKRWVKDFDLMIRIDKRSYYEVLEVIEWCQQDNFWIPNILSAKKLREKFDTLKMQMKRKPQKHSGLKKFLENENE